MSQRHDKPLPLIPQPSISIFSPTGAESKEEVDATAHPFPGVPSESVTPDPTRREYALLELLRSERTYASDLVLLRDYQIPLASGRLSSMSSIWPAVDATICQYLGLEPTASDTDVSPATPQGSSSVSPRPRTNASNISAVSFGSIFTLRPMKTKDVNIVFSNIEELAAFSEEFLHQLESALGELIEGNEGEDAVGRLFLQSIPQIEPLYHTYIVNQPHALEHYHRLSKTFQFDVYFPRSQILAHKSSNAWDLPSLLIKPVQRLLHYPQLLAAIISETPPFHPDRAQLIEAHARMAEIARGLNERWRQRLRQQKVVREVLVSAGLVDPPQEGSDAARARKKSGLKIGLAASVSLGRIMSLRAGALKAKEGLEVDGEAMAVKAGGEKLKRHEEFMTAFTREAVSSAGAMRKFMGWFEDWACTFAELIYADPHVDEPGALLMFLELISDMSRLVEDQLGTEIGNDLVRTVNSLKATMAAPIRLLEAMETLEAYHSDCIAKSRPPSSLLEASQSYMALREQLFVELPAYLTLLDKGVAACILKFAHIQQRFYGNIHDLWAKLWDAVAVDGETNGGATETLQIWSRRFAEVEVQLTCLNILQPLGEKSMPGTHRTKETSNDSEPYMDGGQVTSSGATSSVLAAPSPVNVPIHEPRPSGSTPTTPSVSTDTRSGNVHSISQQKWQGSLSAKQPSKSGRSGYVAEVGSSHYDTPLSRRAVTPISPPAEKSRPSTLYLGADDEISTETIQDDGRGQSPRSSEGLKQLSHRSGSDNAYRRDLKSPLLSNYVILRRIPSQETSTPTSLTTSPPHQKSSIQISALYECRVVHHPCRPPEGVKYRDLPFFTLVMDDVYEILAEAGDPSTHPDLPLRLDDGGEDCLLLMRSRTGTIGWAFARYMFPVDERLIRVSSCARELSPPS